MVAFTIAPCKCASRAAARRSAVHCPEFRVLASRSAIPPNVGTVVMGVQSRLIAKDFTAKQAEGLLAEFVPVIADLASKSDVQDVNKELQNLDMKLSNTISNTSKELRQATQDLDVKLTNTITSTSKDLSNSMSFTNLLLAVVAIATLTFNEPGKSLLPLLLKYVNK